MTEVDSTSFELSGFEGTLTPPFALAATVSGNQHGRNGQPGGCTLPKSGAGTNPSDRSERI